MGNKGVRNSKLQYVAAATLAFAQTQRMACNFPHVHAPWLKPAAL